jgi:hypothetical protein
MKRELLIAAILLAACGMLWAGQNGVLVRMARGLESWFQKRDSATPDFTVRLESVADYLNQSLGEPIAGPDPSFLSQDFAGNESRRSRLPEIWQVPHYQTWSDSGEGNRFLQEVAQQLKNMPPLRSDLLIRFRWGVSEFAMTGSYAQMGQGSGQSRLDLNLLDQDPALSISKVSDGRFLYTLERVGDRQKLEFVDLQQVRKSRQSGKSPQNQPVQQWLLPGELASLLENLSIAFQFDVPHMQQIEGQSFCHLQGVWKAEWLRNWLQDVTPLHQLQPEIVWHKLPQEIPHQVNLSLVFCPNFGWTTQRIVFLRYPKEKKRSTDSGNPELRIAVPMGVVDFASFQALTAASDNLLKIESAEVETVDVTDLYLTR